MKNRIEQHVGSIPSPEKEGISEYRGISEEPILFDSRELAHEISDKLRRYRKDRGPEVRLGDLEAERIKRLRNLLEDPENPESLHPAIERLIDEGCITVGNIKPGITESPVLPNNEDEAAEIILDDIRMRIGDDNFVIPIPGKFWGHDFLNFYYGTFYAPEDRPSFTEDVKDHMESGPSTLLIIYRKEGDAVKWWREQMGATNPKNADEGTLRHTYGYDIDLPNNIVHGSWEDDEVKRLKAVRNEMRYIKRYISQLEQGLNIGSTELPQEIELVQANVIAEDKRFLALAKLEEPGNVRTHNAYKVYTADDVSGEIHSFLVKKKGRGTRRETVEHYNNLVDQYNSGISVPEPYGTFGDALYEQYIEDGVTETLLDELKGSLDTEEQIERMTQLIKIAIDLDMEGFQRKGYDFLDKIIFSHDGTAYFNDTSLARTGETRTHLNYLRLIQHYYEHQEDISILAQDYYEQKYGEKFVAEYISAQRSS